MVRFNLPDNYDAAKLVVQQQQKREEMGWTGILLGNHKEKPGNIAGLCVVMCFMFLTLLFFFQPHSDAFPVREIATALVSLIVGCMGFLFGKSG